MLADAVERNRSPTQEQGTFFENFRPKQAFGGLLAVGQWKFDSFTSQLAAIEQLSCYSAKQAIEARKQATQSPLSGVSELKTGDNARRPGTLVKGWNVASVTKLDC